ncbi:efflux RND transporter periplasmic adaptor subunit [Rufibacter roseus]|uniref:Efflux RND transporter periplasmic adaptor subunit n=1 Tax=Rufibacter roseus TaxID=1567108 RepID=A0ABW2DJ14_9BACT|nr:efflux RND transporter periplasmic adaptor subunit [Rufibacter roseus]
MKKSILLLLVVVLIGYLVYNKVAGSNNENATSGPPRGPMSQKVAVKLFRVSPEAFQDKITATGTVLPNEEVDLRSEVSGRITNLNFKEGSRVRKGQLLLSVNAQEMQAQINKLESNRKLYQDMEKRQRTLLEKEYISQQEYEQARNQLSTTLADLQAQRAALAKAYIRAPFDGVIGLRQVSEGGYVTPTTPIAKLVDISPVKIDFDIPGRYAQQVKVGDNINFSIEGDPKAYTAQIYAIEPNIDPTTRTVQVRARYSNQNEEVKPGAFVTVQISLKEIAEAILIPTEAIIPQASGHQVYLAKDGKAVPKEVKIGLRSESMIQILEGLQPGDSVIRSGILQVRPGAALDIQEVK